MQPQERLLLIPELVRLIADHLYHQKSLLFKAILISHSWHTAFLPCLWQQLDFDRKEDQLPEKDAIHLHRHLVRHLNLYNAKDINFELFLGDHGLPELCALDIENAEISFETLVVFLRSEGLQARLTSFRIELFGVEAMTLVPALTEARLSALETLSINFPAVEARDLLEMDAFLSLLEACPALRTLELSSIEFFNEISSGKDGGVGQETNQEQVVRLNTVGTTHTKIEYLQLVSVYIEDNHLATMLARCPLLCNLYLENNDFSTENTLLCIVSSALPCLAHLGISGDVSIPSEKLFQSPSHHLISYAFTFKTLDFFRSSLDDHDLVLVADSQGQHLESLNLESCHGVSDIGVLTILKSCHKLETLVLGGTAASVAIFEGDRVDQWACWSALKRLDIRKIGILELGHRERPRPDDLRIVANRVAFAKIKARMLMLPMLRKLALSTFGLDEELIQGFGTTTTTTTTTTTIATDTTITTATKSNATPAPSERTREVDTSTIATKALSPLKIHTLAVRGLRSEGLQGSEIEEFLENYPYLRRFIINNGSMGHCAETIPKLSLAGVITTSGTQSAW